MNTYLVGSAKPRVRSRFTWMFVDSYVLVKRSVKHIVKNPDQLIGLIVQPIMFMLLFRFVFGGAIDPGNTTYVNFLVAGILVQMAAFGATTTSLSVAMDMKRGLIDRLKSLPIASLGLLMGHVTADIVRNLLSSVVLVSVALLVGFRPEASVLDWFMIAGLVMVFTFAISWVFAGLGLFAKSVEAAQWMGFLIIFPLTFASAAFVPTETMVKGLKIFAENQPVTHMIEAIRALMIGVPVGDHAWIALVWFVAISIVAMPIAAYLFRNQTNQ